MTKPEIAVIGLGNLGGAIAGRLADEGFSVSGFDVSEIARQQASERGVAVTPSAAGALEPAAVVLTSLPTEEHVRVAWTGPDGIVSHARPGTVVVEMSTIDPAAMREVAKAARTAGLRVLDCPVSGGPVEAGTGHLSLICAGDPVVADEIADVLGCLGNRFDAGSIGDGKTIKLVNNLITNATVLVSAEAFQIGVASGVPAQHLFDVLSHLGGGRTPHFQKRFPWALAGDWRARFSIALAEKDFRLGLDLAQATGVPAPAAACAHQLFRTGIAEGFGDDDLVGVLQLYQRWAGTAMTRSTIEESA